MRVMSGLRRFRTLHVLHNGWGAVHLGATGIMAWWSFILLMPGDTFGIAATFDTMAGIADEPVWAVLFGVIALIGLWGVETRSPQVRRASALVLSFGHSLIAWCVWDGAPLTTGTGTYTFVALLAMGRLVSIDSHESV